MGANKMARSKSFDPTHWYAVEQALYSPRDECFHYRFWGYGKTLEDAQDVLRRIPAGRIIECTVMEIKEDGIGSANAASKGETK